MSKLMSCEYFFYQKTLKPDLDTIPFTLSAEFISHSRERTYHAGTRYIVKYLIT